MTAEQKILVDLIVARDPNEMNQTRSDSAWFLWWPLMSVFHTVKWQSPL